MIMVVKRTISRILILLWIVWLSPSLLYVVFHVHVYDADQLFPKTQRNIESSHIHVNAIPSASPSPSKTTDFPLELALTVPVLSPKEGDAVRHQPLDYEFVVSHYNERLDWLKPLANHSHVYHKGKDKAPPFEVYKWEKLPNVGREGHTYLHHIIHNYDNLANVTVFLQGAGPHHDKAWCFPTPMDFVKEAENSNFCKIVVTLKSWEHIQFPRGKWRNFLRRGKMRKARCTIGDYYKAVFGTPHPPSIPVCYTGCISATRDNLRRHPTGLYQRAIAFLDDHSNPEEGHYMERLWATVINMK